MEGNEHIIKQLYDEHFHHLVLSSLRFVKDYNQAEDIVQDVFVKIWQTPDVFKKNENPKAYLFKAVKNSSLNFLRHIEVRQKFVTDSKLINSTIDELKEETFSDEEVNNRIHQAVNKLPEHWREAFVLSKYDNLKYYEIAEKLNISQKTVEKYMSKALMFLREELKEILLVGIIIIFFR